MGKFAIEIKWGMLFSAAVLIWAFIEKTAGFYGPDIQNYWLFTNLFGVVAIAIYVLALKEKKQQFFEGVMDWKRGFLSGVVLTIIITVFSPLCQIIIHKIIAPEFLPNLIRYKVSSGYLTQKMAESYFNIESYIYQNSSFALSMGVVTACIVAYFIRTKNIPNP
jgi:uncharacterized protein DUF4199